MRLGDIKAFPAVLVIARRRGPMTKAVSWSRHDEAGFEGQDRVYFLPKSEIVLNFADEGSCEKIYDELSKLAARDEGA